MTCAQGTDVGQSTLNSALTGADIPARTSLTERVASDLYRAIRESRRSHKLEELKYLLEKNPEVARILDLMEEVRS